MTHIFTHRGLEPSNEGQFSESTIEAFFNQLSRGFSLEVDLNFTQDGIILCHDTNLSRLTKGEDTRQLKLMTSADACAVKLPKGRLGTFEELMNALRKYPLQMVALHFKGEHQNHLCCDHFIRRMKPFMDINEQIVVFDLSINAAKYLKLLMPELHLAASVAHHYDIERYQNAVKGTLIPLEKFIDKQGLYSWAWLDEWDLEDKREDGTINPMGKKLYTPTVFDVLRGGKFKIALVTPELHGTSPGLLGGEAHPHASTKESLFGRIKEILALQPDALCTDYPEEVRRMLSPQRADPKAVAW